MNEGQLVSFGPRDEIMGQFAKPKAQARSGPPRAAARRPGQTDTGQVHAMNIQIQQAPQNWREHVVAFLKRIFETPPKIEDNEAIDPLKDRAMWIGGTVVSGALLIFILWGSLAPLAQGVVAIGVVEVAGENKTVQHLEGGIVKEMFVREGDTVAAGDTLLILDDTKPRAEQDLLEARYYGALAEIDRLGRRALRPRGNPVFAGVRAVAWRWPGSRRSFRPKPTCSGNGGPSTPGEIDILNRRVGQLGEKVNGLQARREAAEQEQALLEKEVETLESLADKDYVSDEQLTQQRLSLAQTRGSVGQIGAEIAEAQLAIGESEQQIIQLKNDYRTELSANLTKARNLYFETGDRLAAVRDQVARTRIPAPQEGKVINMQVHTVGGVVPAGRPIMNIVPEDDALIVEAQVRPTDVDNVLVGQDCRLRITPFKQRATPELTGEVLVVSADIVTDEQTQVQYYLARIAIPDSELARLGEKDIRPGFPVEVTFSGSTRTLVQYPGGTDRGRHPPRTQRRMNTHSPCRGGRRALRKGDRPSFPGRPALRERAGNPSAPPSAPAFTTALLALAACALLAGPAPASAQQGPGGADAPYTLNEALRDAVRRDPRIRAAGSRVQEAGEEFRRGPQHALSHREPHRRSRLRL